MDWKEKGREANDQREARKTDGAYRVEPVLLLLYLMKTRRKFNTEMTLGMQSLALQLHDAADRTDLYPPPLSLSFLYWMCTTIAYRLQS